MAATGIQRRVAAINGQGYTGDGHGGIGAEEDDWSHELFRLQQAVEGDPSSNP